MFRKDVWVGVSLLVLACAFPMAAQQNAAASASTVVPSMVKFSGSLSDLKGRPLTGVVGVTFSLYKDAQGGSPLWMETQNVQADKSGHYSVMLGSTTSQGLPGHVFANGEARWLGVKAEGQEEQPRVLLLSVPYALKALDAETIGGKPASAFAPASGSANNSGVGDAPAGTITGSGTKGRIPRFTGATTIGNSAIFQNTAGKVGVGTTTPAASLDVNGTTDIRNTLTLFPNGSAPALSVNGTALSIDNKGAVSFVNGQKFPGTGTITGVTTASGSGLMGGGTSGTLNLGLLTTCATKQILQWNGSAWVCITANPGTITGVTAGTDLSGGGTSGNVTLNLNTTATDARYAQLGASDNFTQPMTIYSAYQSSLKATSSAAAALAVFGYSTDTSAFFNAGVYGVAAGPTGFGVEGNGAFGVLGFSGGTSSLFPLFAGGVGVNGDTGVTGGVSVVATADDGNALWAENNSASGFTTAVIEGLGPGNVLDVFGPAGSVSVSNSGDLAVSGTIFAGTKDFRIDHPLVPSEKYLTHASIESSEMLNLYTGNAVLGADGSAAVSLPDWFTALNEDFRYQLTPIGGFAPLYIAEKITANQFRIAGGRAGLEVSWQITGVRHDAYAKAHPLVVESDKQGEERGHYLHPDAFGQPLEMGITAVHRAQLHAQHGAKPASAPVTLKGLGVTKQVAK
jgi:hypothetical protein